MPAAPGTTRLLQPLSRTIGISDDALESINEFHQFQLHGGQLAPAHFNHHPIEEAPVKRLAFIPLLLLTACATPSRQDPAAVQTSGRVQSVKDWKPGPKPQKMTYTPSGNTAADAAANVMVNGQSSFKRCDYTVLANEGQTVVATDFPQRGEPCTYEVNACVRVWIAPEASYQSIDKDGACK